MPAMLCYGYSFTHGIGEGGELDTGWGGVGLVNIEPAICNSHLPYSWG